MKKLVLLIMLFPLFLYSQEDGNIGNQVEIIISNYSGISIDVRCYPISMIMNSDNELSFLTGAPLSGSKYYDYNNCTYVNSSQLYQKHIYPSSPGETGFNYDTRVGDVPPTSAIGSFGRGIYKIIFYNNYFGILDSVFFEQDAGLNLDVKFIYYGVNQIDFSIKQPDPLT